MITVNGNTMPSKKIVSVIFAPILPDVKRDAIANISMSAEIATGKCTETGCRSRDNKNFLFGEIFST